MAQTLKLIINNSYSVVEGLTVAQYKALREVLSYRENPQATYFSGDPRGGVRYLLGTKGTFPTGLLYIVLNWFERSKLPLQLEDLRKRPGGRLEALNGVFKFEPYPEQLAIAELCGSGVDRGVIIAPTGLGKSVIIALIVHTLQLKTLIVVPGLELKSQLTATLIDVFGKELFKKYITVENIQALNPNKPSDADCLIVDEFHHSAAKSYRDLNRKAWAGIYHRYGLTATPFRSQPHEKLLLESFISETIYEVKHHTAVSRGYIAPVEAYYVNLPKTEPSGHTWAQVYKELVVKNTTRNNIIANLLKSLNPLSTLCLVEEIAHGEALSFLTGIPFANGVEEGSKDLIARFSRGDLPALIATSGVAGEGVDTRAAEYVVIAGLGKSRPALMQKIGRVFRRFPGKESGKVIIFRDPSHKWTLAHFREQVKTIKEEYGVTVSEI